MVQPFYRPVPCPLRKSQVAATTILSLTSIRPTPQSYFNLLVTSKILSVLGMYWPVSTNTIQLPSPQCAVPLLICSIVGSYLLHQASGRKRQDIFCHEDRVSQTGSGLPLYCWLDESNASFQCQSVAPVVAHSVSHSSVYWRDVNYLIFSCKAGMQKGGWTTFSDFPGTIFRYRYPI